MKIIVANYRYFVAGGPEKYMFNFMQAAEKRGVEIIPFSVSNPQNRPSKYSSYFAKPRSKELLFKDTKRTLSNYWGFIRAVIWNYEASWKLKRLIKDTEPDAVYILHEINHLSPSIIHTAHKEGVRVVHRISDFFMFCAKYDFLCGDEICEACLKGSYSKAIKHKCVKGSRAGTLLRVAAMKLYWKTRVFDEVDKYISTCDFSRRKLIEGGIPENKVICIPTFINAEMISPSYENEKYFLFLGRIAHQKGTLYAVKAMNYLKDTDFKLKITGELTSSDEDQKIRNYIVDHNLQDKIIFTGFKQGSELDEIINHAVCIVCPAIWYENFPNTIIEAYAHGKPVIASRLGSLEEMVEEGITGFLVEPKNAKELSDKMKKLINNKNLSSELGKNARKKCEQEFSEKLHMERVLNILGGNKWEK